jgi:hypothetical protein
VQITNPKVDSLRHALRSLFGFSMIVGSSLAFCADEGEPPMVPEEKTDTEAPATGIALVKEKLHDWGLSGSLRGAYWSSNRRLDDEKHIPDVSAWLKLDRKIVNNWGVFVEGYLNREDPFDTRKNTSRFREAYAEGRAGDWDFRFGKQIIAWGRADRFNPTDNLTPRDFTLLAPETDEDRFGSVATKASWNWNASTNVTAIWLPIFRPHVFFFPSQAGISIEQDIPDSHRQWAVKLDQSGKAVDWSVSCFDGFDLTPDLSFNRPTATGIVGSLRHNRTRVIGGDAATTLGAYRLATEIAYTRTEDNAGTNPDIKNSFWYGVVGVERNFEDNLTVNTQFFARRVNHYSDPEDIANPAIQPFAVQNAILNNQYDKQQYGLTFRISKKWLNETLEGELAGAALLNRSGYLIRPKVIYAYSDSIKLIGGFEYFGGSDKTSYGRQEKNRGVFAEMRYYF